MRTVPTKKETTSVEHNRNELLSISKKAVLYQSAKEAYVVLGFRRRDGEMNAKRTLIAVVATATVFFLHLVGTMVLPFMDSSRDAAATIAKTTTPFNTSRPITPVPVNDTEAWRLSPVCRPTFPRGAPIRRLFFSHTRKAAGTLLVQFFRHVARRHGWKFTVVEGTPAEAPRRHDTLYVTHLRHPVARALSMYRYGRRWPCRKLVAPHKFPDYTPTANNSATLEDFIEHESGKPEQAPCHNVTQGKPKLWVCAKNCYLRWYGTPFNCLRDVKASYATAKQKLMGYNLVVVMERLADPAYRQGLLRMFGNLDTKILEKQQDFYCSKESKYWNDQYPAVIQESTLANLTSLNEWDIRLYDELNHCPDGVHFPAFDPGRESSPGS